MAICRWSSMDFACDLYIYESAAGVTVHVATKKRVPDIIVPPLPASPTMDQIITRINQVDEALEATTLVPIGLSCDGETFEGDAQHIAAIVEQLLSEGYRAPADTLEVLRDMAHPHTESSS